MSSMVTDNFISDPEVQTFREDRTTAVVMVVMALSVVVALISSLIVSIDFAEIFLQVPIVLSGLVLVMLLCTCALPVILGLAAIDQIYSRLVLSAKQIKYLSYWSQKTIPIWDVTAVNYLIEKGKERSKAVIQISSEQEMIKVELAQFEEEVQDQIVSWIHERIDPRLQHDWPTFETTRLKIREEFKSHQRALFWVGTIGWGLITIASVVSYPSPLFLLSFVTVPLIAAVCWMAWKKRIFANQDDSGDFEPTT